MATTSAGTVARVRVQGKFLFAGSEKYWVKGVTYGTFRPTGDGSQFPEQGQVGRDFAAMAANGINTVRTYTPPPRWLLDAARQHGLRVMAGLAWEQHVTFLDDRKLVRTIEGRIREGVKACSGHPALLCYSIGNEIPPSIVRWHGRRRIERFLHNLYRIAKAGDPEALVTYVNFPTTEYLQLPFLDFHCFNVYLESRERLDAYLSRLQNLVGERPLLMAEIGLDSRRNGEPVQAESLEWQVRSAFEAGCAGTFVFSWTDEWYRGGQEIEEWDFGITNRDRSPKPALAAVRKAYGAVPFPADTEWPRVTVVCCSYNGAPTIRDTLEGLKGLDYPDYEVILVNDGSTDETPDIAGEYDVRLISTENRGLSNARNRGWQEASGELIAYIDDDAYPDPHWLQYIAHTFMTTDFVGVGGPNIAPPGDGPIADCVANAPGRPVHVLITDREAEHIPGCNMVFRREALQAIGGFDPRYRAAGDDVDLCWRLQAQGWKIGFHAAAVDWHHCRNSVKTYWKQQQGYGKAEALLEEKWPEKYNALGHFSWSGRLYGKGITAAIPGGRWRIYQGTWGSALFQSIYEPAVGFWRSLPLMPEWFLVIAMLAVLSLLGLSWGPLSWAVPLLFAAVVAPVVQAVISAARARFPSSWPGMLQRFSLRGLTAGMHLMQPVARLIGRLRHGLTPVRRRVEAGRAAPRVRVDSIWMEEWQAPEARLEALENALRTSGVMSRRGGDYDDWDLEVSGGLLASVRGVMTVEEHGAGRQMVRFRAWPRLSVAGMLLMVIFLLSAAGAALDHAWTAALVLGGCAVGTALLAIIGSASAMGVWRATLPRASGS